MGKHEPIAGKMNIIWLIVSKPGTITPLSDAEDIFDRTCLLHPLAKSRSTANRAAERNEINEIPGDHHLFAETPHFALSKRTYMSI